MVHLTRAGDGTRICEQEGHIGEVKLAGSAHDKPCPRCLKIFEEEMQ